MRRIVLYLFVTCGILLAQEVELIHSDKLESFDGGKIVQLTGSVKLRHAGRILKSAFARWDKSAGTVTFRGQVEIDDTNYVIFADALTYFRKNRTARASGEVRFVSGDSSLFVEGAEGFYDGDSEFVRLAGNPHLVKIDSTGARLEVDARFLAHFIKSKLSLAVDSVRAKIIPADSASPPIFIFCDSLEYFGDSNLVVAYGGVRIVQESLVVFAPRAVMWRDRDEILLSGGASVKNPHWQLWADSILVHLRDNRISSVLLVGNPRGKWHDPADSLNLVEDSRFSADSMYFLFDNGRMERAVLLHHAKMEYHPATNDSSIREYHIISGDSICALVADSRIDSVEIHRDVSGISYQINKGKRDSLMYSGDFMALSAEKRVHLYNSAQIKYQKLQLEAGQIHFDGNTKVLSAEPVALGDSLAGVPFLRDDKDSLRADTIEYNVQTRVGILKYGRTAADKGFFTGRQIAKSPGDTFYIKDATFTTCDRKPPHYYFYAPQLKLIPKDKAIARPIVMYIGRLPVFWLPFFVFSVNNKRHSGILTMDVGKFQKGERFVRNLGYYWAPNDYFDIYGALDIDENSGIYIKGQARYAWRYHFSGNIFASYKLTSRRDWNEGVSRKRRWELRGSHSQTVGERAKISANLSMVSDADYLIETEDQPQQRMERTLRSYVSFSQGLGWGNLSAAVDRTQNLSTGTITTYLPKISLRRFSGPVFGMGDSWYNRIYLSAGTDLVEYMYSDSTDSTFREAGADANLSVSLSYAFGDYLSLSPQLQVSGVVQDRGRDGSRFPMMFVPSASTHLSTDLYGNIPFGVFGVKFFHHIVSPSVGIEWTPEVSGGEKFYYFGGIAVPSGRKKLSASFSLNQQFGLKKADSTGVLRRIHLFSVNSSFSYNFIADQRKFSDITTTVNAKPSGWMNLSFSFVHTLYTGDETSPSGLYLKSANMNTRLHFRFPLPFEVQDGDKKKRDFSADITHYLSKNLQSGLLTNWIKFDIKTFITPNWKVSYNYYYDLQNGRKVSDEVRLWRDMHCWEAVFVWVPSGIRAGYYVRINVKEIPEIKIERTVGNVRWH